MIESLTPGVTRPFLLHSAHLFLRVILRSAKGEVGMVSPHSPRIRAKPDYQVSNQNGLASPMSDIHFRLCYNKASMIRAVN